MLATYKQILSLILVLVIATGPAIAVVAQQDNMMANCEMAQMLSDKNNDRKSCPMHQDMQSLIHVNCDNNSQSSTLISDHQLKLQSFFHRIKFDTEVETVLDLYLEQISRPPKS